LLGLAAGDAVGTALEFRPPGSFTPIADMVGGGPFSLAPGQWTDDTSMALCLAESLVEKQGFDPVDQLERYVKWWREGYLSSTGKFFDIGKTTSEALERFERTHEAYCGSTDPRTAGNGSIMRLAPVPMFFARDPERAIEFAADSSRTTHGAPAAIHACRFLAALTVGALQGASKEALLSKHYCAGAERWNVDPLMPAIRKIAGGSYLRTDPPEIRGGGYVVESLEAALWAFRKSDSFRDGCLLAANLGDDADTTAAVYGQLAGAFYGEQGIPESWLEKLAMRETIVSLADRLGADRGGPAPLKRSYWVDPGKFLAGAYPGDLIREMTEEKLRWLLWAGIRCFVNLTTPHDCDFRGKALIPYRAAAEKVAAAIGIQIFYHRRPIMDVSVPTRDEMREILDVIDASIGGGQPVYVHCLGGIGRTGTVVGCWLVRHGRVSGEAAVEMIRALRKNEPQAHRESPETDEQRRFISEWKKGD
jgi:ADP-ribosylglycohydrolase